MKRFDTPREVAYELARHVPQNLNTVLDPAVGAGALLIPLAERFKRKQTCLYCIDLDSDILAKLEENLMPSLVSTAKLINADFLDWSFKQISSSFDCILMNPPFSGTKRYHRQISVSEQFRGVVSANPYMPLEAAFLCKAHDLLKNNGRLLAILPSSIIMSQSMQWLRNFLFKTGAVRSVHELPARTFNGVESRMYLLVFDKTAKQRKLKLFNHDLKEPERLDIWLNRGMTVDRLDFGYHKALQKMQPLTQNKCFGWCSLGEIASILRGDVLSPIKSLYAVHTSEYIKGFWYRPLRSDLPEERDGALKIKKGDLLVKRVGRNSYRSFGRFVSAPSVRCSDCVFIIRPKTDDATNKLLFALSTLTHMTWTKPLLERGTGANYITKSSLFEFQVPTKLNIMYPDLYASFVKAQHMKSTERSIKSTQLAARLLEQNS